MTSEDLFDHSKENSNLIYLFGHVYFRRISLAPKTYNPPANALPI